MTISRHAQIRMQQRSIPPMVDQLLDLYGQEEHDGHGAVTIYLNRIASETWSVTWVVARYHGSRNGSMLIR